MEISYLPKGSVAKIINPLYETIIEQFIQDNNYNNILIDPSEIIMKNSKNSLIIIKNFDLVKYIDIPSSNTFIIVDKKNKEKELSKYILEMPFDYFYYKIFKIND